MRWWWVSIISAVSGGALLGDSNRPQTQTECTNRITIHNLEVEGAKVVASVFWGFYVCFKTKRCRMKIWGAGSLAPFITEGPICCKLKPPMTDFLAQSQPCEHGYCYWHFLCGCLLTIFTNCPLDGNTMKICFHYVNGVEI